MPDPFRKVQANEEVTFSATAWNAFIDAALAQIRREQNKLAGALTQTRNADIIKVRNETGGDLPRNSVVGLAGPIFSPDMSLDAFLREVTFRGVLPTHDHLGKFAIMLDPSHNGWVSRAYVSGVCQVKVDVVEEGQRCADVEDGNTTSLVTSKDGSAEILWLEGDTETGYGYETGLQWGIVRFGNTCGGQGTGGRPTSGRCDCPDPPYEVEVNCGDCEPYYGTQTMPRFWIMTIVAASTTEYGYYSPCDAIQCENTIGARFVMEHDGLCKWDAKGPKCLTAELSLFGERWKLVIADKDGCILAILYKDVTTFACCGTNTGWYQLPEDDDVCTMTIRLEPHPCTCCPEHVCPPDGKGVCSATTCCLEDCNCNLTITVVNLATGAGLACTEFDLDCTDSLGNPCVFGDPDCLKDRPTPEESCGGMNGVYHFVWKGDCTWRFTGVPLGTGSVYVKGELTLDGTDTWTMKLRGPDGQYAEFRSVDWDCEHLVPLPYYGGTCPVLGPAPFASFNLCQTVTGGGGGDFGGTRSTFVAQGLNSSNIVSQGFGESE